MARPSRPALPRFFLWLLPLSFALQVATIGAFHQYRTRPGDDNFEFGWEMGRVARSIALGNGFSSPYGGDTGPTAWEPPLYPYLMGGVFRIFGIYTHASAWILLSINSLFTTLTCIPIFWIAHRTFGERIAALSVPDGRCLQDLWHLHSCFRVDIAQHQQPVHNAHLHPHLLDRAQNFRGTHCRVVRGIVGALSVRLVLVGSLDLGHDIHATRAGLSVPARLGIARMAGLARLGDLRRAVWRWSPR